MCVHACVCVCVCACVHVRACVCDVSSGQDKPAGWSVHYRGSLALFLQLGGIAATCMYVTTVFFSILPIICYGS